MKPDLTLVSLATAIIGSPAIKMLIEGELPLLDAAQRLGIAFAVCYLILAIIKLLLHAPAKPIDTSTSFTVEVTPHEATSPKDPTTQQPAGGA